MRTTTNTTVACAGITMHLNEPVV